MATDVATDGDLWAIQRVASDLVWTSCCTAEQDHQHQQSIVPLYTCETCQTDSLCWACINHCHLGQDHQISTAITFGRPNDCSCVDVDDHRCFCSADSTRPRSAPLEQPVKVQTYCHDLGAVETIRDTLHMLIDRLHSGLSENDFQIEAEANLQKTKLEGWFKAADKDSDGFLTGEEVAEQYLSKLLQIDDIRDKQLLVKTLFGMNLGDSARDFMFLLDGRRNDPDAQILAEQDESVLEQVRDAVLKAKELVNKLDKDNDNQIDPVEWISGLIADWREDKNQETEASMRRAVVAMLAFLQALLAGYGAAKQAAVEDKRLFDLLWTRMDGFAGCEKVISTIFEDNKDIRSMMSTDQIEKNLDKALTERAPQRIRVLRGLTAGDDGDMAAEKHSNTIILHLRQKMKTSTDQGPFISESKLLNLMRSARDEGFVDETGPLTYNIELLDLVRHTCSITESPESRRLATDLLPLKTCVQIMTHPDCINLVRKLIVTFVSDVYLSSSHVDPVQDFEILRLLRFLGVKACGGLLLDYRPGGAKFKPRDPSADKSLLTDAIFPFLRRFLEEHLLMSHLDKLPIDLQIVMTRWQQILRSLRKTAGVSHDQIDTLSGIVYKCSEKYPAPGAQIGAPDVDDAALAKAINFYKQVVRRGCMEYAFQKWVEASLHGATLHTTDDAGERQRIDHVKRWFGSVVGSDTHTEDEIRDKQETEAKQLAEQFWVQLSQTEPTQCVAILTAVRKALMGSSDTSQQLSIEQKTILLQCFTKGLELQDLWNEYDEQKSLERPLSSGQKEANTLRGKLQTNRLCLECNLSMYEDDTRGTAECSCVGCGYMFTQGASTVAQFKDSVWTHFKERHSLGDELCLQEALASAGFARVVVSIGGLEDFDIHLRQSALRFGTAMLEPDEPEFSALTRVQKSFQDCVEHEPTDELGNAEKFMRLINHIIKGLPARDESDEEHRVLGRLASKFVQRLCENHCVFFQDYMRVQRDSRHSFNLIEATATCFEDLATSRPRDRMEATQLTLDAMVECVQGPNRDNQQLLAEGTLIRSIHALFEAITADEYRYVCVNLLELGSKRTNAARVASITEAIKVKRGCVQTVLSMLEGSKRGQGRQTMSQVSQTLQTKALWDELLAHFWFIKKSDPAGPVERLFESSLTGWRGLIQRTVMTVRRIVY